MDIILDTIVISLSEIITSIVICLLGIFGSWLLSKLSKNKNLKNISLATEQVLNAARATVLELQQTFVEDWKRAQNGKLTPEQVDELQDKLITITMAKLSEPTLKLLTSAKVDTLTMITSAAEGYILELKKDGV